MYVCWSVKGGSGTTVVSAALSLVLARSQPTVLVDLHGDAAAVLGLPEPAVPGVHDWLASPTADSSALQHLLVPAHDTLRVLHRGDSPPPSSPGDPRWATLVEALTALDARVVVDAGLGAPGALAAAATASLLVVRPCYLALRRVVRTDATVTGVVLVTEPGRALGAADVERAVGAPVVAQVPYDPAVARAVDSGLLASRLPRSLLYPLRSAA
jgi:MinD-like ATPase involved in chromosome partitioning or flagellar assembly